MESTTCFHHAGRETGRACTRCGRPACADCLRDAPVGAHCWECVRAARPPARERVRRWNATAGPLATKILLGVNLVVFVLTTAQAGANTMGRGGDLQLRLALFGPAVADGEWYRLVTAGFVHYGIMHLGFNMFLLYQLGSMLEAELGRVRFVALYAAGILGGSFGALLLSPDAFTGGASGGVFGLVGAAALALRSRGLSVWQSGIGGLLAINLVFTFAVPGISVGGHLGGLAGGSAAAVALLRAPTSRLGTVEGLAVTVALVAAAAVGSVVVAG